jgi:23S rRNA pseudouridine1911/1915/1917 synthase
MPYRVQVGETVFESLEKMFAGRSRKDLRRLLHAGCIHVNGAVVTDPLARLKPGDAVDCARVGRPVEVHPLVRILHEDDQIVVVEKGAGILTSGGVRGRAATVEDALEAYLQKRGVRRSVHACHRLDRDVSGVLLLAKERRISEAVRAAPKRHLRERVYHALVEGVPQKSEDLIRSYLKDGVDQVVRAATGPDDGKLAITRFRVLESRGSHALLEVRLETGRKNQIRAHLSQIGHPIAGDRKYGAKTDPWRRVCLHAAKLTLVHPLTHEVLELESTAPAFSRRGATARER